MAIRHAFGLVMLASMGLIAMEPSLDPLKKEADRAQKFAQDAWQIARNEYKKRVVTDDQKSFSSKCAAAALATFAVTMPIRLAVLRNDPWMQGKVRSMLFPVRVGTRGLALFAAWALWHKTPAELEKLIPEEVGL